MQKESRGGVKEKMLRANCWLQGVEEDVERKKERIKEPLRARYGGRRWRRSRTRRR